MKKKLLLSIVLFAAIAFAYNALTKQTEIEELREKHATFLKNHSFNKTMDLSKKERKALSLPPNAYFEQEYLNEINPTTGRTHKRELLQLQEQLNSERLAQRAPGDATDNAWVERGPDNVGGRTRVVLFDPNDISQETVYAGGVSGGLWKNTNISNANSVWSQVGITENLSVSSIAVDPNDSNIWYVGTGESYTGGDAVGNGLWKTIDGGATWNHVFGGVTGDSFFVGDTNIQINSSATLTGDYTAVIAQAFGGDLVTPITGDLVLVEDGAAPINDGCSQFTNAAALNGKIAVIRRGVCAFTQKVKRAQDAGALAVIIANNVYDFPFSQGGTDASITIPSIMVSREDGDAIINALTNVINVTLSIIPDVNAGNISPGIQHINDLVVRNNNGVSEVYFAAGDTYYSGAILGVDEIGVYKSTDGTNFTKLAFPETDNGSIYEPNNIEIATDNSIYVSTKSNNSGVGGGRIFQSTNGNSFTLVHTVPNGVRTEIACSKSDANTLYILSELSSDPVGIYKTTDNFATVTSLVLPNDADTGITANDFTRGQAFYDLLLRVDPNDDNVVYVGGIDLFKTLDGGTTWNQLSHWYGGFGFQEVHADQHGLAFSSSSRMVFSNDGGVYFSDNGGTDIAPRKKGYNTLQFYTVGVAPTTAFSGDEYFLAGAQDNGSLLIENAAAGVNSFYERQGGDGAYSFFDQDGTDTYCIANYVYNGNIRLYDLATGAIRTINNESGSNGDFINQEALDSNLDILYSNYSSGSDYIVKMYRNIKAGTVIKTDLSYADLMNSEPSALTVSPYTTNQSNLFIGLKRGKVLKIEGTTNTFPNSPTWADISGPDFVGSVSDIEFGTNENEIFVTMHNYGVQNVWYTTDGGANWSAKEGNLPDIPVKAILQNPLRPEEVIIGTALGVWRTADFFAASPTWIQSYNGMSNVKVTDLDLRDDNMVFAATYGRGVFSGQFTDAVASVDAVFADKKAFTAYPTVSNGNFTLQAENSLGLTKMDIFSITGKQVYTKEIDFTSNGKQGVSVNLNAGVYIVSIVDENNKKSSSKIVIE